LEDAVMAKDIEKDYGSIPDDVRWLLQRADGFLDIGMTQKARAEIAGVPEEFATKLPCRLLVLRLAFDEKDWSRAAEIANGLREEFPGEPGFWIQLAYAKRRAEGLEVAHHILIDAAMRFPGVATIPFNLACYECQLGREDEAMRRLNQAFLLDEKCRDAALEDEDLKPIWHKLGD
jgi:hypothetical protein